MREIKEKWDNKKNKPQEIGSKDNATLPKKFNASDRGQVFWFEELNKGNGRKPL